MRRTSHIFLARAAALILFALVFLVSSVGAQDNAIYAVHNSTAISTISNQATGAITNVGTLSFGTSSAARDPLTGRVYYLSTNAATPVGRVAYWNPATGANTTINSTGSPGGVQVVRLAFNAAGVLYGFAADGTLYTINTSTGAYTQVGTQTVRVTNRGNVVMPANGDIAFAPDGTMYAAVSCTSGATTNVCLYSINPTPEPTAVEIGNLATLPSGAVIASLAYGIGGTLYAGASNGAYISVNTTSGAGTLIATNAGNAYWDFASMPKFADLSITKTAAPNPVLAGGTLTYTLRVTNNGAHAATNVRLSDPLPAGTLYRSHTAPAGWTCTTPAAGANGTVACTNGTTGSLANGANADFTITVSAPTTAGNISNTATVTSDTIDTVANNNTATATTAVNLATISGIIFEDVHYGGGAGRSVSVSGGAGRGSVRVELYNSSGNFVTSTTTSTTGTVGAYTFTNLTAGDYTVRVVNNSVTSSRTGAVATLLPVQTFRTTASSGASVADPDRVGGEDPRTADAAGGAAGTTMNTTTGVFTAGITGQAQSIAPVTLSTANATGVDFGFNFSTVVNTNNTGQGSLRQFITNSNALTNGGLAQAGLSAGRETSIFIISDGAAHAGLRAGLPNQLTSGVAVINLTTALPAIADTDTAIDGTTQTANVGNTNSGSLGAGGNVGVDNLSLSTVARPEVQIVDGATIAVGLDVQVSRTTIRGLSIYGFGNAANSNNHANIRIGNTFTDTLIEANIIGSSAISFTDPGAGARSVGDNIRSVGADNGTVRNNLIGFSAGKGFGVEAGSSLWTIENNEIRGNAIGNSNLDGIDFESAGTTGNTARGNLVTENEGVGVDSFQSNGSNTVVNNTITANGRGTGANVETAGVRVYGSNNTIERNIISGNYGAGVMVTTTATTNLITRNSIFGNGTVTTNGGAAASNQIGIDLQTATDNFTTGTAPYVTINDSGDADAGGNGLLNFPVLERATINGTQLTLVGFARPGANLEFFIAAPDASGFGEGQTYLVTLTEGSAADTDATNATYTSPFAGRNVGTDTTERFSFTIALPSGVTLGSTLTATATVAGSTSEFSNLITIANTPPSIELVKSVSPEGDITPGTDLTYTIAFTNTGGQSATGFRIIDPDPASALRLNLNTDFKVASATLTPGTTGLTATVEYSNDNAATWTYTPTSAAGGAPAGYDRNVTHVRWVFTGSLSQAAPNNAGSVSFIVRVR